ncbi:MAG: type II toxin-antitoxin system RelE/ParE family toxin [Planctomycetes bacterium]|nr:type II toxin-antitoxin system RelE/ParE family toxin [Planctomycetota bacterium]
MSSYCLTPQAQAGLANILKDVEARFGVEIAIEVLDRIGNAFQLIANAPQVGHRREDITPLEHVYFWHVGPTLIAYQVGRSGVEILFVERGERDWAELTEEC